MKTTYHPKTSQNLVISEPSAFSLSALTLCIGTFMLSGMAQASPIAQPVAQVQQAVQLPVIKVTAQQEAINQLKIDREQLERNGANDMASIVKYLPLVSAPAAVSGSGNAWDGSGTSGYNIRGVDGNRVGIDIDGVDLASGAPRPDSYKTTTSGVGRDFIDPEMMSQVDITSGTTGAHSDGLGGRVSFKTKSPDDYLNTELNKNKNLYGEYKAGYSSANDAWLNSVTAAVGNESVKALVAYAHRQGKETKSEGKLKENPVDWNSDAILSRVLWNITPQQQLGFTFDYYTRDTDRFIDANTLGAKSYPKGGTQAEVAERTRYALDYSLEQQTIAFDELKAQAYYQNTSNENRFNTFYIGREGAYNREINNDFKSTVWGLKLDANKTIQNHELRYGLGGSTTTDDRPWVEHNLNKGSSFTQNRMVKADTDKYFAYISDQMSFNVLNRNLKVTPGLRYEYQKLTPKNNNVYSAADKQAQIKQNDSDYFAPSLNLSYQLGQNYLSYFNYSRGVRIPSAAEMMGSYEPGKYYSVLGNSNLKKESSDAFELGFKTTPIKGLSIDINGFYTQYKDFIDYRVADQKASNDDWFTLQLDNIADVNIWGGELAARLELGEFFDQSQGYSVNFTAGKAKASGQKNDGSKAVINSVQPEKASLAFNYDAPDQVYGLSLKATAVGSRQAGDDELRVPGGRPNQPYKNVAGYAVADLSAYWNVNKYTTVNLGLNNIFDKKYADYAKVGLLTKYDAVGQANLIDRAIEPGRNVVASVQFKY
ncbi:hemoglobin/transferrin/lactoferrin receptor protein [Acinetobacter calcoaceticus]|uniref:Hemoglobin/transferrin/lactoferrin receptor protein n=1 Tax=Acinetobacter calcoaceticus TaxID=471 RepID=A0A4R1XK67_ACICA|nr:hemoglobin/transferrin/lactoferrin receptor protein [Acinetobacter calcoaceticus]